MSELSFVSTTGSLDLETIEQLTGGGLGVYDTPCPLCGPAPAATDKSAQTRSAHLAHRSEFRHVLLRALRRTRLRA